MLEYFRRHARFSRGRHYQWSVLLSADQSLTAFSMFTSDSPNTGRLNFTILKDGGRPLGKLICDNPIDLLITPLLVSIGLF